MRGVVEGIRQENMQGTDAPPINENSLPIVTKPFSMSIKVFSFNYLNSSHECLFTVYTIICTDKYSAFSV